MDNFVLRTEVVFTVNPVVCSLIFKNSKGCLLFGPIQTGKENCIQIITHLLAFSKTSCKVFHKA